LAVFGAILAVGVAAPAIYVADPLVLGFSEAVTAPFSASLSAATFTAVRPEQHLRFIMQVALLILRSHAIAPRVCRQPSSGFIKPILHSDATVYTRPLCWRSLLFVALAIPLQPQFFEVGGPFHPGITDASQWRRAYWRLRRLSKDLELGPYVTFTFSDAFSDGKFVIPLLYNIYI
jgi:hypothetical protein